MSEAPSSSAAASLRGEVHLWCISRDACDRDQVRLEACLCPDERVRAARLHSELERRRFIATHGIVREILAGYLGIEASEVRFEFGPFGKPALDAACARGIEFNVSHSRGLALVAVAAGRHVGVDVEFMTPGASQEPIAERFFSPAEVVALRALPQRLQDDAFFACWTRKEAYVKARGEGLSIPLAGFTVSLAPDEPAALLDCVAHPEEVSTWSLRDLAPAADYRGALAVDHGPFSHRCRDWPASGSGPASPGGPVSN